MSRRHSQLLNYSRLARAAVIVTILLFKSVVAQQPVGSISGIITDPTGAVISGAAVTVTSMSTGATRTVKTNDEGFYIVTTLQPGEYKVVVENKGFANFVVERVVVAVGQNSKLDAALKVETTREEIQVVGTSSVGVDTMQSTVGGVINPRQIEQLPLNGRNYLELARLQPGIEIQDGGAFDPTKSRYTGISVGGRQGREARITVDGIDAVDEHVGTTTINISQDSIQEFQVSTSSSDSSTGLSATGAVNIITKRGSNSIHGSGFLFSRSDKFAARPSFAGTKPDFDREQWGFNVGGPFVKNKLFWFANFEQTNEDSSVGINTPYFPTLTSFAAPFDERSSTVRADWRLPRQNELFFRWSRNDNSNFGGFGGSRLPSTGNINTNTTHQYVWGLDTAISPKLTNSFRAGLTDFKNRVLVPLDDAKQITVPGTEGFRILTDDNLLVAGPDTVTPQSTFELFGQFRDDLTYSAGNHTLRGGIDIVRRRVRVTNFVTAFPTLTVVSPASRNPADILNAAIISFQLGNKKGIRIPGTDDNAHRNTRISWYGEDVWRMRRNFTLNYGVRYEVDTHPLNNDLDKPQIVAPLLPHGTEATPIDKNNLAPHFGFAWDPFGNGKTSIRGGAGIYYAMRISNLVTNERASLAGFNSGNDTISLTRGASGVVDFNRDGRADFDFTPALGAPVRTAMGIITAGQNVYVSAPALDTPTLQITRTGLVISNDLITPYSQQFNIGIQRELPFNSVLDVNFLYTRTVHEFMRDIDAANLFRGNGVPITLGDGAAPNRAITVITSDGFSRYRAFTARVDKRFSNRYQLTASYALARLQTTIPDGLGLGGGALVNRNVQANFGPGALDRTHRLTVNAIADLPWGFRLSGISSMSSGLPATALVGSADLNGDGINGDLLPGTGRGSLGRDVDGVSKLNTLIRNYNQTVAGRTLPRGGRAPFLIEIPETVRFGDTFISQDIQLSKIFRIKERLSIEATVQVFNIFNVSNLVGPAGLPSSAFNGTLTTIAADTATGAPTGGFRIGSDGSLLNASGSRALAGIDRASGFGSLGATRPAIATGTGLPRATQFGLRVSF